MQSAKIFHISRNFLNFTTLMITTYYYYFSFKRATFLRFRSRNIDNVRRDDFHECFSTGDDIILVALFSKIFINCRLCLPQWCGAFLLISGLLIVGIGDTIKNMGHEYCLRAKQCENGLNNNLSKTVK